MGYKNFAIGIVVVVFAVGIKGAEPTSRSTSAPTSDLAAKTIADQKKEIAALKEEIATLKKQLAEFTGKLPQPGAEVKLVPGMTKKRIEGLMIADGWKLDREDSNPETTRTDQVWVKMSGGFQLQKSIVYFETNKVPTFGGDYRDSKERR